MDQIVNVLKTYEESSRLRVWRGGIMCRKKTERGYLRLAAAHDADLSAVLKPSAEELRQALYPNKVRPMVDRKAVLTQKLTIGLSNKPVLG